MVKVTVRHHTPQSRILEDHLFSFTPVTGSELFGTRAVSAEQALRDGIGVGDSFSVDSAQSANGEVTFTLIKIEPSPVGHVSASFSDAVFRDECFMRAMQTMILARMYAMEWKRIAMVADEIADAMTARRRRWAS